MTHYISLKVSLDIWAISEPNFLKPALFTFKNDYYALVCMVISQFNHQIILFARAPSNPLLNLPFKATR